jgi:hypothetical protein
MDMFTPLFLHLVELFIPLAAGGAFVFICSELFLMTGFTRAAIGA